MTTRNNNKTAVITGAGRINSVGAAIARALAKKGYNIVITCHKNSSQAQKVQEQCLSENVDIRVYTGDLTQAEARHELASMVAHTYEKLDVLINCLGITESIPYTELDMISDNLFSEIMSVNAIAPFQIVRDFQKLLTSAKGCVINISSSAGMTGIGSSIPYSASKGAENTLTLALAKALAPDIRVNAICPSFIDSSWWEDSFRENREGYKKFVDKMSRNNVLGKIIKPDDVAQAALFLIDNPVITGELLRMDAGAHLGKSN